MLSLSMKIDPIMFGSNFIVCHVAGLIAAACGQLDTVLKYGHASKVLTNGLSNGKPMGKVHQNGNGIKSSNGSLNGVYSNGNGVHNSVQ